MNCYKTHSIRSANVVEANRKVYLHPTNPLRRVMAMNAKRSLGDHRYDIVRVFYVRTKLVNRWQNETVGLSKVAAEEIFGAAIPDVG